MKNVALAVSEDLVSFALRPDAFAVGGKSEVDRAAHLDAIAAGEREAWSAQHLDALLHAGGIGLNLVAWRTAGSLAFLLGVERVKLWTSDSDALVALGFVHVWALGDADAVLLLEAFWASLEFADRADPLVASGA